MRKNYYIFVFLIFLLLFLIYNIIVHKYKEYKINEHIEMIAYLNKKIENQIEQAKEIIEYKSTKAYKNKILKQDRWLKNKWEIVVYLMKEDKYNKYISKKTINNNKKEVKQINDDIFWMTIYQKWIWFIFHKDLR